MKGLRARGGYTVDMEWRNGVVEALRITSLHPSTVRLCYPGSSGQETKYVEFTEGEPVYRMSVIND